MFLPEYSLDVDEFNLVLIIFSGTVISLALVALVILYCQMSCGCCKKRGAYQPTEKRRHSNIPQVMVTQHREKTPLSIDCPDLDFIDARNTNLVSSTVQVDSVHQTPRLS
ncbi:Protein CBG05649 [Caenorhabditis briggsae]|uniref:Protein CBG05649 n=3 Tax=Caenorhabditis TaxID=6237 RepID=A8X0C6_CAEBR|nr:Protein CBG05649 [Caenorhabditis briggsae]PIC30956.1 hypothetical protein B9Z55_022030 [Caenorhabditis nigoni]ULT92802.1 hypothetical protein L3Y34_010117 [Caenorhabditis briggsae]CAP26086.1 Protein CBG05649 [Caenorhabditis briggsae]